MVPGCARWIASGARTAPDPGRTRYLVPIYRYLLPSIRRGNSGQDGQGRITASDNSRICSVIRPVSVREGQPRSFKATAPALPRGTQRTAEDTEDYGAVPLCPRCSSVSSVVQALVVSCCCRDE